MPGGQVSTWELGLQVGRTAVLGANRSLQPGRQGPCSGMTWAIWPGQVTEEGMSSRIGLPDLASRNTQSPVNFEFQINKE